MKNIGNDLARFLMGTIFLVIYIHKSAKTCRPNQMIVQGMQLNISGQIFKNSGHLLFVWTYYVEGH